MEVERGVYYAKLEGDIKNRYDEKIEICGGIDPYTLKEDDLSVDRKDFPNITTTDIANYMICSISLFTHQTNNVYKSTEAYNFFDSGFVLNVGSKIIKNTVILTGKVKHSQKMNDAPLRVWVLATIEGKINSAHCTCVAGLSETCSHVGAVCYAVSMIHEANEKKSVTEILCKWNVPSFKDTSMKPATDIEWRLPSQEPTPPKSNFRSDCDSIAHLSDAQINEFIKKCNSHNDETALETILYPFDVKRKTNLRDQIFLASIYDDNNRSKSLEELVEIGASEILDLTNEEVQEISRKTLPHLKSKAYIGLQRGRITGSNFKICCEASITDPCIATINRVINPIKLVDVPSMKYHNRNMKAAINSFLKIAAPSHDDFQYSPCGLIINPKYPYFAASPDGLVNCDCHGDGCVVVKCLKMLSSGASMEVLTSKPNNILNKHETGYSMEETHEFYYQIQLQIYLVELEYCDFIIWSPNAILPLRIYPDIDFWTVALKKSSKFHELVIMSELLGKFYTKNAVLQSSVEVSEGDKTDDILDILLALEIELLKDDEAIDNSDKLLALEIEILE